MKKLLIASLLTTTTIANADIILSKGIKNEYRDKIERDLDVLSNLKFKDTPAETLQLLGLKSLSAQTATQWLNDRVKYVVAENALSPLQLILKRVVSVERQGVTYPNATIIPYAMNPANKGPAVEPVAPVVPQAPSVDAGEGERKIYTVMSNIGAGIYFGGKDQGVVYSLKISRGLIKSPLKAVIESPRVGIIQIGEGLFLDGLSVTPSKPNAVANSLKRLSTFFHEARHSDGNGVSLAFAHSVCPTGHNYAGSPACDENLNGPYTVGALFTTELLKACDDSCTEVEKTELKADIVDSYSRVLKTTLKGTPATLWDATPESL